MGNMTGNTMSWSPNYDVLTRRESDILSDWSKTRGMVVVVSVVSVIIGVVFSDGGGDCGRVYNLLL